MGLFSKASDDAFEHGRLMRPDEPGDTPISEMVRRSFELTRRRDDHAISLMRVWRGATCVVAVVAVTGWGAFVYQSQKSQIEWLVVKVDQFGQPGEITDVKTYVPSTAELAERARAVVKAAFSKSVDPAVNAENWQYLQNILSGAARTSYLDWVCKSSSPDELKLIKDTKCPENSGDPSAPEARRIKVVSFRPAAASSWTFTITWDETDYKGGKIVYPVRRMTGDLTFKHSKPQKRVQAEKNILGLYITSFIWSQETS